MFLAATKILPCESLLGLGQFQATSGGGSMAWCAPFWDHLARFLGSDVWIEIKIGILEAL